jgi:kynureninase
MVRAVADIESFATRAREMDQSDPLRAFSEAFTGLDGDKIYLDGNSLGPLPKATSKLLQSTVEEAWGDKLIQSWNEGWYDLPERMGNLLAPLIGAQDGEVCFADSVTVNLFKLAAAALKRQSGRHTILTDNLNFPSDYYALDGLIGMLGQHHRMQRVESEDGMTIPTEQFIAAIDEDTALVTLSHVVFKSGFMHDLAAICAAAHAKGAMVLADISHSVGSVPIQLGDWGVDMAIGCSYKYLNGGPGAPAFLFVRKSLQEKLEPQLAGWFGAEDPFAFRPGYAAAKGIRRFMVGTPPILSLQAVEPGIQLLREAGMDQLREKSVRQSELMIELYDAFLEPAGFQLGSPRDASIRGSHIALKHPEAFRINRAMINSPEGKLAIIPDFRTPDNLRLGIAPLFLSHLDIVNAVDRIRDIVVDHEYKSFSHEAGTVT